MTPEEIEKARNDYDALPGTFPDEMTFVSNETIGGQPLGDVIRKLMEDARSRREWGEARATIRRDGLYFELWIVRPFKATPPPEGGGPLDDKP